ncbi:MAG: winged helix-turn-helix domain-containing protein [Phycisphaerales bacterium]|nr:winged helix-turn-helix domain-containing protein [Phycisphaerales bacterium]
MSKKTTKKAGKVAKTPKTAKTPKAVKTSTDGKPLSGLDAAAKVLADAGQPMRARELVNTMIERGLWKSGGKTPHATIYAAMIREIAAKKNAARFRKTDRGLFAFNG